MRMLRIDAPIFPAGDFTLRIEQAIHELFAFPMPTFGKNGAAIACCNAVTAQCLQFRKVWRDKGCDPHEPFESSSGAGIRQCRSAGGNRSEEHTSELQSLMRISYAVFCLKKKKKK